MPSARLTLCALALLLSGCAGVQDASDPTTTTVIPDRPVIQPGQPGEANATHTGPIVVPVEQDNEADARFMAEMIVHHAQALEMVERSREGLGDAQVTALAQRIESAQGPEVQAMAAWLVAHDRPVPKEAVAAGVDVEAMGGEVARAVEAGGHGHGHAGMPGMATPAELEQLSAARGQEADLLFLELMTRHHEGALEMAAAHGAEGSDVQALEMSTEMHVEQTVEIERMADLRERVGR